jgi:N-acetyltransferase 10
LSERERELKELKDQFREDFPVGPLIGKCCTMDQVQFNANSINIFTKKILVPYVET